jgi:putative ABC transport system permease protein
MFSDLRYAFRQLAKSPGFTAVALLTLALGIGANTAMFSLMNAVLLRPAPFPDGGRLVRVLRRSPQSNQDSSHSPADYLDIRNQNTAFAGLTAFAWSSFIVGEPGEPAERWQGLTVADNFFATLGGRPALGRVFTAADAEPGRPGVIVLSHGLWMRRFGGDPAVVGRTLHFSGGNVTVIGVMPADFAYPLLWPGVVAWTPLVLDARQQSRRDDTWLKIIGRLNPGVSLPTAQTQLTTIAARLAHDFPKTNTGLDFHLVRLPESAVGDTGRGILILLVGLSGFVLLIACANLANLQLARTAMRTRDYAIRAALGASRVRLMRQLLTESGVLATLGGALGLLLALWINDAVGRSLNVGSEQGLAIPLERSIFVFALVVSVATGLVSGLVPAWFATRTDLNGTLKNQSRGTTGSRSQHRFRHGLIVAEIALAIALLAGAGFFVSGLQRFSSTDRGWNPTGLLIGNIDLPQPKYADEDRQGVFAQQLRERLAALPGVDQASCTAALPVWPFGDTGIEVEGQPAPAPGHEPQVAFNKIDAGYFSALQIPLVEGRTFPATLRATDPKVIVINETMARRFWPQESAIGKRIRRLASNDRAWREVIGVVRDVSFADAAARPTSPLQAYRPLIQDSSDHFTVVLRSATAPAALTASLRREVAAIDPNVPVDQIRTATAYLDTINHDVHVVKYLLSAFALLGLGLAAIGLYGVIANLVAQRLPEFGIRIALGAAPADVIRLVLSSGLRLVLVGGGLGLVSAVALLRLLGNVVPALSSHGAVTLTLSVLVLVATALTACWLPARRASRVDPVIALRAE